MERLQWGWAGTVEDFLATPAEVWIDSLGRHLFGLMQMNASASQVTAWKEEGAVMRATLRDVCVAEPAARQWGVAFEYELPLEGGRRPDVVVLAGRSVVVLEFKQSAVARQSAMDQVEAYARDLSEYHAATHGIRAVPVVVITGRDVGHGDDDVSVVAPDELASLLQRHAKPGSFDLHEWLNSEYAPLPMLIAAARKIFLNEPLPAVKRALSSSIPEAVDLLGRLAEAAAADGQRVLAFVAGVPGSGKTLAGLSLVYERVSKMSAATFLSGNGPLVEVLRDALKSRAFVNDLHAFIKTYGLSSRVPKEHVIVFDEAQRAWDEGYMNHKHGVARSEPDLLALISHENSGDRIGVIVSAGSAGARLWRGADGGWWGHRRVDEVGAAGVGARVASVVSS
ncbi:MAG: DUF2075 domain-containing protein [Polyangiaceae bacterium]|nr:DUF2075 domain-containing protein [Polyangiaceae bacterium]